MSDRKPNEVVEWAKDLEDLTDMKDLRETVRNRYALVNMTKPPSMPKDMEEAGQVIFANTPSLKGIVQSTLHEQATYATYFTVANLEGTTKEDQKKADALERAMVMAFGEMNQGGALKNDIYWHQFVSAYCVAILKVGDDDPEDEWCWPISIEIPDILTCFFPLNRYPARPPVLARRFKMLVGDLEREYSQRLGPYEGKSLRIDGKKLLIFSDDMEADSNGFGTTGKRLFQEVSVTQLYEGDKIMHVLDGVEGGQDEELWSDISHTGGIPVVIIPGEMTPQREAKLAMEPVFQPQMAAAMLINDIRARILTYSDQYAKPTPTLEQNPDEAATGLSVENPVEIASGAMISTRAKVGQIPFNYPADLKEQLVDAWQEWDRLVEPFRQVDPDEVVQQATANLGIARLESRKRQLAPALGYADRGLEFMMRDAHAAAADLKREFNFRALSDAPIGKGKRVEASERVLFPKGGYGFDYKLRIETQSTTAAEKRMRAEDAERWRQMGVGTRGQVMDALYDDRAEQDKSLAIEAGTNLKIAQEFNEEKLGAVTSERLYHYSGIATGVMKEVESLRAQVAQLSGQQAAMPSNAVPPPPTNGATPQPVPGPSPGDGGTPVLGANEMTAPAVEGATANQTGTGF